MAGIWFSVFIGLVNISSIATNSTNFTVKLSKTLNTKTKFNKSTKNK